MKNKKLPTPFENVMVTFVKDGHEVTKMGFYSDLFGNFSIPPSWKNFNGVLLPDGFGGLHLKPENIIKWSKINN